MKEKGFALAIEAILALLIVAAIASMPMQQENTGLTELHILQKENDLLKIWLQQETIGIEEMEKDFGFVFPGKKGSVSIGSKKKEIGGSGTNNMAVSSEAFFYEKGKLTRLTVSVNG